MNPAHILQAESRFDEEQVWINPGEASSQQEQTTQGEGKNRQLDHSFGDLLYWLERLLHFNILKQSVFDLNWQRELPILTGL